MSLVREKGQLVRKMSTPTCVRNYELSTKIGQGAFGVVYSARSSGSATGCAIKIINLKKCTEKEVKNCRTEAKLMQTIQHKHLVGFIDAFEEDGKLYIVMEFCGGGSLRKKIEEDKMNFPEQVCLNIFSQICEALKYLHCRSEPIVHRDVKTSNIFIDFQGHVKLGDFGVARVLEKGNFARTMDVGTPYYMSPDVVSNNPYDTKTDIWSLGLCLYEMAHKKRPFDSVKDAHALKKRIQSGEVTKSELPYDNKDMTKLFQAMVKIEPEHRPNICEVLEAIQCIKDNKSLDTLREHPSGVPKSPSNKQNSGRLRSISESCHPADNSRKHSKTCDSGDSVSEEETMLSQGARPKKKVIDASEDGGLDVPNCGIERTVRKIGLGSTCESDTTDSENKVKRKKKKSKVLSKSFPPSGVQVPAPTVRDGAEGSSGYISTQLDEPSVDQYQKIQVEVELTQDQLGFYKDAQEMEKKVQTYVKGCPKVFEKIKTALYATRQMESSQQFEVQVRHIFNENDMSAKFDKCKPYLVSLWQFKTQLLTKPLKIKWI